MFNQSKKIIITCFLLINPTFFACAPNTINTQQISTMSEILTAQDLETDAQALMKQGKMSDAIPLLQKSLSIYKKYHSQACSDIWILMGDCYKQMNKLAESEKSYYQAMDFDIERHGQNNAYVSRDLNRIATLYLKTSKYYRALTVIEQAVQINQTIHNQPHFDTARDLTVQAILYERLGRYHQALEIQEEVLTIVSEVYGPRHEYTSTAINNLATSWIRLKQYQKAIPLFTRALTIDQKNVKSQTDLARDMNNLGIALRNTGQYQKAKGYFKKALTIYKKQFGPWHPSVAATLNNLGNVLTDLNEYHLAEINFSRAITISQAIKDPNLSWHIWDGFRELFAAQNKLTAAIFFGKQAVYTIQAMRKHFSNMPKELADTFIKSKSDVFRALAELLIRQGRLNEAQWVLRMLKEEEYFQMTFAGNRGANVKTSEMVFSEIEQQWQNQYQHVNHQLIALSKEHQLLLDKDLDEGLNAIQLERLDQLEGILDKSQEYVQTYIKGLISSFDQLTGSDRRQELSEKQLHTIKGIKYTLKQLGEDVALIHYIVMSDCVHILLTTSSIQIARKSKIDSISLNQTIAEFRHAIENRQKHLQIAQLLYGWLIAPIESDLVQLNARILMLSLDEMLRYAPFASFHSGEKYLIQKYQITVYTEAARDKLQEKPDRRGKIAGVGLSNACPKFNLPALHAVPEEIESIVRNGPDDHIGFFPGIVHLNERFSFKSLRRILRRQYNYLHIASHFVLVPGDEKSSFLILGDQTTINLIDIEQKCDFNGIHLLTLSACNTAMGSSGQTGREIEGFGTLAQNNGAQSVLATLWAVNDSSTGIFMQMFYHHFAKESGNTKAVALQQAQCDFIAYPKQSEYRHPFFWAPFVLMGNWQ
jgi:CHAT domain-containing protein/Tfp pilus assembly protein PilF